jgi:hypothetical protein
VGLNSDNYGEFLAKQARLERKQAKAEKKMARRAEKKASKSSQGVEQG